MQTLMEPPIKRLPYLIDQIKLAQTRLIELRNTIDTIIGSDGHQKAHRKSSDVTKLSRQEQRILQLMGEGKRSSEIGSMLNISKRTVETHRYNMQRTLGISSRELKNLARLSNKKPHFGTRG